MQETKIQRKDLRDDMVLVPGWDVFFSLPKHKKGYSGVAIYTRNSKCAPIRAEEGVTGILTAPKSTTSFRDLPLDQQIGGYPRPDQLDGVVDEATLDSEGRCVVLEFPAFVLFGVYSPANRDESRDEFRLGFLQALDVRIRNLVASGKQVILTGDLNVIRSERDSTNVTEALRKENMSIDDWMNLPARRLFNHLIFEGSVVGPRDEGREEPVLWDLCRCFHPDRDGMNTCWDTKRNTRPANNGSRIDYILCSDGIKSWFDSANIQEGLMGSDHCPVFATIKDTVEMQGKQTALPGLMNPSGVFRGQNRLRDWGPKDLLPLSAKLIPEFDRRQSIRDMFTKKKSGSSLAKQESGSIATAEDSPQDGTGKGSTAVTAEKQVPRAPAGATDSKLETVRSDVLPYQSQTSAATPAPKRSAEALAEAVSHHHHPLPPASKTTKKPKIASRTDSAKAKVAPGQKTLQGFFKPKAAATPSATPVTAATVRTTPSPTKARVAPEPSSTSLRGPSPQASSSLPPDGSPAKDSDDAASERVFDPIEAKESWSKLLAKRVAPRCEHHEPCISLTTKKPGVNCGRSFYICPRPLGPSGEKEKGSEWRCGTFIWSSDWNGSPGV